MKEHAAEIVRRTRVHYGLPRVRTLGEQQQQPARPGKDAVLPASKRVNDQRAEAHPQ